MTIEKKFIIEDNDLMLEWNWDKNNELGLNPNTLTFGSNKKAWWVCEKGHECFTPIYKKIKSKGCPYCSNRFVISGENDFATKHPDLMKEWDFKKNTALNPNNINDGSEKKAWWICSKCGSSWQTMIKNRSRGAGCLECAKKLRGKNRHNNLLTKKGSLSQKLLNEWNYERNVGLNPSDYHGNENKKVWWLCSKCKHEWIANIRNRSNLNRGCPCCAKHTIIKGVNDLATTNPELVNEWHPTKNNITPYEVAAGSRRKVWWLCSKGHEYQASLLHRKHGTRCPICYSGRQTSFAEQCVYFYIKQLYPDAISRYKSDWLGTMELDIFIPSINYAIEYDGIAWHKKDKLNREQQKYKLCRSRHIKLIRLRERFAELGSDIADYQYGGNKDLYKSQNLEPVLIELLTFLNFGGVGCPISINIERDKLKIQEYMTEIDKGSFADLFPDLSKEWHPTRNGTLTPNMFKPHSTHKVWWLCPVCKNEYKTTIDTRSYGSGCKKCAMKRFFTSNSKSVEMIDIETNKVIKTFKSISDASRETKINTSNITMVCKGVRKYAGGYIWKYTKKD